MNVSFIFIVILCFLSSCKKQTTSITNSVVVEASEVFVSEGKNDTIAYFSNALTYQIEQNGEPDEIWIYVNEETQQLIYIPNDDMIEAVISYPDGRYKIFGTDEDGKKQIIEQTFDVKKSGLSSLDILKPVQEKRIISQKNIQQNDLECSGYYLKYLKMEGGETLFVTTQIPINSYQLYGFSKLDGDANLPIHLDFINILKNNELITHIQRDYFILKLLNYGTNPYEFNLTPYEN